MDASVTVTPQPEAMATTSSSMQDEENTKRASSSSSCDIFEPMVEFSRRLDDIISTYGCTSGLLDHQGGMEAGPRGDITPTVETDVSILTHSLDQLSSPEEKLDVLLRKYIHLADLCSSEQQKSSRLEAEHRSGAAARCELETLCRDLQSHYSTLREEALQRRSEDEEKRNQITSHFQETLTEIRAQIQQHSARNDKLCRENASLTDKLENLMSQCDRREESLEKIERHRDLQHKLAEAKLQEANALLAAAEDKHKREKEYLLREAIEKTKSCYAMKEQELTMKKKLTLYAQKFDEFQETLAKSNEIYVRFKKEMENMSAKMKKVEKESSLWKTRFENCNKALTDMIEERTEKGKEYELFVLKIQKLEKLCRALQDERAVLYEKIKDVRHSNSELPSKILLSCQSADEKAQLMGSAEIQEMQENDPVLTQDMARLKEEQAKLKEFAAALLAAPVVDNAQDEVEVVDPEEDVMASTFINFRSKVQVKEDEGSISSSQVEPPITGNSQETSESDAGLVHDPTQGPVQDKKEDQQNKHEDQPMVQASHVKLPQLEDQEEAAMTSESANPASEDTGETHPASNPTPQDPKKQQPKKKKKRVNKNIS